LLFEIAIIHRHAVTYEATPSNTYSNAIPTTYIQKKKTKIYKTKQSGSYALHNIIKQTAESNKMPV